MPKKTGRSILISLSRRNGGRWEGIMDDIRAKRQDVDPSSFGGWTPITILDDDYPEGLNNVPCPPFVIYCKGSLSNIVPNMLLLISPLRYEAGTGAEEAIAVAKDAKAPVVINWKHPDEKAGGNGLAEAALRAYSGSGIPFIVVFSPAARDMDLWADKVAEGGGLAITEKFPGSQRRADPSSGRIGPAFAKAALVLGGKSGSASAIEAAYALNSGLDIGALSWPASSSSPGGELCNSLIEEGAAIVASGKDVLSLAGIGGHPEEEGE